MRLSKRQWGLGLLVVAILLSMALFFRHYFLPLMNLPYLNKTEFIYQNQQEKQLESRLTQVLTPLLGARTFSVSVTMALTGEKQDIHSVSRDPQSATTRVTQKWQNSLERLQKEALSRRPSLDTVYSEIQALNGALPGVIIPMVSSNALEELPGFPVVQASDMDAEPLPDRGASPNETQMDTQQYESETRSVFFNEKRQNTQVPTTHLKRLFVNVVIDKDHFKLLTVSSDRIMAIVQTVSGFDASRGDQLSISYEPFLEKPFSLQGIYLNHRAFFDAVGGFIYHLRWVFLVGVILSVLGAIGFYFWQNYQTQLLNRQREAMAAKESQEEAEKREAAEFRVDVKHKQEELSRFAHQKPAEFAELLLNWVELSEKEGPQNGTF